MKNLGSVTIVLFYMVAIFVGKGISDNVGASSIKSVTNPETITKSLANDFYHAMGMDDFFDSLSKGL